MGKKLPKSTKKFAASGRLKKVIEARHGQKKWKKNTQVRKRNSVKDVEDSETDKEQKQVQTQKSAKGTKKMSVDDFLSGNFMGASEDEGEVSEERGLEDEEDDESVDDESEVADDESFASVDDLEDEGKAHMLELTQLAEKDPEFYKYLQENDRELLEFKDDADNMSVDEDREAPEDKEEDEDKENKLPTLTMAVLKKWQKALLEHRSLRALRRMLIAFRSAAHVNEEDQVLAWNIDNSAVYNKLVTTTLRYTPVVLAHHVPYKKLPNGRFKPPTQTPKFRTLQKLIQSYFQNVIHIISQLTDYELLRLAVSESAKLIPYIMSSRKAIKHYLKKCLELWSTSEDNVRLAAIVTIRMLASSSDESILDSVLRGTYLTIIRSSKSTTPHTLPSINLMKNSASDVFCIDHSTAYQHAFGFIRQLAIHLRNSMKIRTKESYKEVYNWQFVHAVDFWSIVLAKACQVQLLTEVGDKESELKPLMYPLVQVGLGATKSIPNGRSHPFHLHIIRSLLHLIKHTHIYIPLSPYLVPILTSALAPSSRPKSLTLRPLDFNVQIRIPQQYVKTRIFYEGLMEETSYLLAEWLVTEAVHGSIAFPEIVVPIVVQLRKSLKDARAGQGVIKNQNVVKNLLERIEDSVRWVEEKRKNVMFGPGNMDDVTEWERDLKAKVTDSPLFKYVKVQRKARDKRQKLAEKAREGENAMVEDMEDESE
ncbi:hypothetical protein AX15_006884 [Amanita polypyramis BW_CC]|nr:hypothetical protein AX15_006884 [Amanita polypyramis BW_CC]